VHQIVNAEIVMLVVIIIVLLLVVVIIIIIITIIITIVIIIAVSYDMTILLLALLLLPDRSLSQRVVLGSNSGVGHGDIGGRRGALEAAVREVHEGRGRRGGRDEDGGGDGRRQRRDGCCGCGRRYGGLVGTGGYHAGVRRLPVGEVGERAAGALEEDAVRRMGGGEGVARLDGVGHQSLPVAASAHRLLQVDLGLPAPHRGGDGKPGLWRSLLKGIFGEVMRRRGWPVADGREIG
jgi:hypothetical protein